MSILKTITVAVFTSLLLAACAQEEKPEGVIPEGYKSALDKAQGVEGKLEDAMQQQGQAIDESGY
jgi:major membrane immunogen (membrane-anchored lipoprotein)